LPCGDSPLSFPGGLADSCDNGYLALSGILTSSGNHEP
jgi:hypothetical protein